mmetsp:Transcript_85191/g.244550  ORF Transcript_85191/g.244550 Transcript_85191/m.244550 type:complete len:120 (-) Transcript_85191:177-536(-)
MRLPCMTRRTEHLSTEFPNTWLIFCRNYPTTFGQMCRRGEHVLESRRPFKECSSRPVPIQGSIQSAQMHLLMSAFEERPKHESAKLLLMFVFWLNIMNLFWSIAQGCKQKFICMCRLHV